MNRIDRRFDDLKKEGKKALITFITAGDPDIDTTYDIVLALEEAGADIIELGIPYSDPLADGPTIQASSQRALAKGIKIKDIMDLVMRIREKSDIPIVYLVYYNSVFKYGIEKFLEDSKNAGVDGLIIPDLPLEERKEVLDVADKYEIYLIPLVAPTSKERIKGITENGKGFVYCVTLTGVTGAREEITTDLEEYMRLVSSYTSMPKALGFGISGPEMARKLKSLSDGIVVGSAIVERIAKGYNRCEMLKEVKEFVLSLREVL
ncbi:MAG: Tryptophan synthase alpha chain [Caldanaerobacter subterraneus]|uniref:Tryptophan synthase alpha chain n=2 Tax=Caldanaerobacter subterraneus TaxID=911092 RepID=TRPA_CALS4|nr:tryptophan synthase subunit alpha [Caldanaerobacter subterraneus]Q8R9N0.1 RecName: Full=Tryptophan synthase alpha chain [Caldanaerobacter subterraneus subsp. tengcongensis MB4]AAM24781.1 Tryptophan synthase alpha chain [Caldanaerobacter subterraneus subsp. tengcongensis MB4]KUK08940.1 MAG: Tryptophan synthase alpha chain [Caldanaerobacter subterraneus]MBE3579339.1 tryptophan synthase subunit alpha [Caldanaerobacter subterraneus]MCS3915650.1 tryptophan synthase alpha chain [Caldanaerobacter 